MKRHRLGLIVFAFVFISSVGLPALDVSVTTSSGTLFGAAHEFVYDQNVSTNYKVSELDWMFQPIFYYGTAVHVGLPLGLYVQLSARSGVNALSGPMTDSDFLNGDGVKTLFSQSDNYTEQALLTNLAFGAEIPVSAEFVLSFSASLDYSRFKWSARDGYLQYPPSTGHSYYFNSNGTLVYGTEPPWTSNVTKTPLYGTGIVYEQQFLVPMAGASATYSPGTGFSIGASFSFSPFVFAQTTDNHMFRLINIYDSFSNGLLLEPAVDVTWELGRGASLRLSGRYRLISGLVGNSTWQYEGTTSTSPNSQYIAGPGSNSTVTNGGGASFEAVDASLSFRLSL